VLVVEDDAGLRRALATTLGRTYQVHTAAGGNAAVEVLKQQPVDAVLLDLVMADGDGYTVLMFLRSLADPPSVVVNSVVGRIDEVIKTMQLGAVDYVHKPTDLQSLREALDRAIRADGRDGAFASTC
jgi:DNA-binding NtrC family response regulator